MSTPALGSSGHDLPRGTITFLLTDIEGSTRGWLRDPPAMAVALARHDELIEQVVAVHGGQVVRPRGEGDSRFAVFARASDALHAAVAMQLALQREPWLLTEPIRVRMAIHTGEADVRLGDYYGPAVNHCGGLRAIAHGGQVLVSALTAELVRESLSADVTLRALGSHQLKGVDVAEHVWQVVHPELLAEFPPLSSIVRRQTNLPDQLSSFVGRTTAIAELAELVARTRLVTLTGPGGVGKTRLALQAAAGTEQLFPDGTWFVRLEALVNPELVPASVASVLGVSEQPGHPLVDTLSNAIGDDNVLLVLDNCEHLVQTCAELADQLVQNCRRLHILATSREPFGVPGELVWRVPPLSLADVRNDVSTERLREVESVKLFVDRARAAQPGFELTERNAQTVAQICARVDGLPLAIELAAARINMLTPEELNGRLDQSFRLLGGGSRRVLPRQQTLRAAIDWSYALLPVLERALLRRVGVFASGWTLEAAEAVCGGTADSTPDDVLNHLSALVDKSLVAVEERDEGKRYRLLDTIRGYAVDLLESALETDTVRRLHAEYFVMLAEQAEARSHGPDQLHWFRRLHVESENLRAALKFSVEHGREDLALRLGSALWFFWYLRNNFREGRDWLEQILAMSNTPSAIRGRVLNGGGYLTLALGEPQRAMDLHEQALSMLEAHGDARDVAMSRRCLGRTALQLRDFPRALALLEEALVTLRAVDDTWGVAACLHNLGNVAIVQGEYQKAEDLYNEALRLRRQSGNIWGIASSLSNLGVVAMRIGDVERAVRLTEQAFVLHQDLDQPSEIADALSTLASAARIQGDFARAETLFEEALALRRRVGGKPGVAFALVSLAQLGLLQAEYDKTARRLLEALALQTDPKDWLGGAATLETLAELAAALGHVRDAVRILGATDSIRESMRLARSAVRREAYERTMDSLRTRLGAAELESELAVGRGRSADQALLQASELLQSLRLETAEAAASSSARAQAAQV